MHSYLILAYAEGDKVAMNVGFYYMANAGGRLAGTVLSGALYQWRGLEALPVGVGRVRARGRRAVAAAAEDPAEPRCRGAQSKCHVDLLDGLAGSASNADQRRGREPGPAAVADEPKHGLTARARTVDRNPAIGFHDAKPSKVIERGIETCAPDHRVQALERPVVPGGAFRHEAIEHRTRDQHAALAGRLDGRDHHDVAEIVHGATASAVPAARFHEERSPVDVVGHEARGFTREPPRVRHLLTTRPGSALRSCRRPRLPRAGPTNASGPR